MPQSVGEHLLQHPERGHRHLRRKRLRRPGHAVLHRISGRSDAGNQPVEALRRQRCCGVRGGEHMPDVAQRAACRGGDVRQRGSQQLGVRGQELCGLGLGQDHRE
jgi:hypothetical protein